MQAKPILPYNRQCIDEDDIKAVMESLKGDLLTTGPISEKFESALAEYVGAKYAVVCSNGTAALFMCMQILNLGPEDAVLVSPITFVADANAARNLGADVVFADIDPSTANLDLESVKKALRARKDIKVVIPVHFGGHPLQMEAYQEISQEFGVTIVDDACHAIGASYTDKQGKKIKVGACAHSAMTVFSFHPIKNITTGEGGAITTNDYKIYEKLLALRRHGIVNAPTLLQDEELAFSIVDGVKVANPWYYEMQSLSCNYRLTEFQSALGLSQLKKLDRFVERRNFLAKKYREEIDRKLNSSVIPLKQEQGVYHGYHLFPVTIEMNKLNGGRAALMLKLQKLGIFTQVHYIPIYLLPYYQKYFGKKLHYPKSDNYYQNCLSLPLFTTMKDDDPCRVVDALSSVIKELGGA